MPKFRYLDDAVGQVSDAVEAGLHTRLGSISHKVDYSRGCSAPVTFETVGRLEEDVTWISNVDETPRAELSLYVDTVVACRRCERCLRARSAMWRAKAEREFSLAPRTWFGTLTLSPHEHFVHKCRTDIRLASRGVDADALNADEYFFERCSDVGVTVTKFLKRVRTNVKTRFRYVVVFERHASGEPHVHFLLHEMLTYKPITKRELEAEWHVGFSKFRLARDKGVCGYIMKYITKSYGVRIRPSLRYGATDRGSHLLVGSRTESEVTTSEKKDPSPKDAGLFTKRGGP